MPNANPSPEPRPKHSGPGGTEGGLMQFGVGTVLTILAIVFFFNSVIATTRGYGLITGAMHRLSGNMGDTTSMGIVFMPFVLAVVALFYDASKNWAWMLLSFGILVLVVEVLSRVRFEFSMRLGNLLLVMALFAAGVGLILRSYKDFSQLTSGEHKSSDPNQDG
ncbi:MAG: hypothetical protein KDA87_19490 [Planctomycetales bacterium]|nr:hypothetical protein [Planctomycetales bacterium]